MDGRLVKTAARADVLQQEGTQDEPLSFSAVFGGMSESVYGYEGETDLPTRVTGPDGRVTALRYGPGGRLEGMTLADGQVVSLTYDEGGALLSAGFGGSGETVFSNDGRGNVTGMDLPGGGRLDIARDMRGFVTGVTLNGHGLFTREVDALGRVTAEINGAGERTEMAYTGEGRVQTVRDAMGRETAFEYDGGGRLVRRTDPDGKEWTASYDALGQALGTGTPDGREISRSYTAQGNLSAAAMDGKTTNLLYDPVLGQVVSTSVGLVTAFRDFDPVKKTVVAEGQRHGGIGLAMGHSRTLDWRGDVIESDSNTVAGKLTVGRDALGRWTRARRVAVAGPEGGAAIEATAARDAGGRIVLLKHGDGSLGKTAYTEDGLVKGLRHGFGALAGARERGALVSGVVVTASSYLRVRGELEDNRGVMSASVGDVAMTVSQSGGMFEAVVPLEVGTQVLRLSAVDKAGNVGEKSWLVIRTCGGAELSGSEPLSGSAEACEQTGGYGVAVKGEVALSYSHDALGRVAEVVDSRMGTTSYAYDDAGRLLSVHRDLSGSAGLSGSGALSAGLLLDPDTASTYPHILSAGLAAGLAGFRDVSYSYDAAGNRLGRGEVVNVMNQVTEDDFFTYAYDDNGNRSVRTDKATGAVERYWYDTEGHLIRYDKEAGGRLAARARYLYDGYGRRLMKVADYDGEGLSPSEVLFTTHEEDNVLATQWCAVGPDIISLPDRDLSELSIAPRWCREYTLVTHQDKTLDQPLWITVSGTTPDLAAITGAGAPVPSVLSGTFVFHRDHLGSVIAITDIDGAVKYSFFYDAYGSFTVADGGGRVISASALPRWVTLFTYTGREYDAESGLFHYRARAYDPESGRFLQQDPVWQPNLYAYVGSDPLNNTDPMGSFSLALQAKITLDLSILAIAALNTARLLTLAAATTAICANPGHAIPRQRISTITRVQDCAPSFDNPNADELKKKFVYLGYKTVGGAPKVRYVGITNNIERRRVEHKFRFDIQEILPTKFNYVQARSVETWLMRCFRRTDLPAPAGGGSGDVNGDPVSSVLIDPLSLKEVPDGDVFDLENKQLSISPTHICFNILMNLASNLVDSIKNNFTIRPGFEILRPHILSRVGQCIANP